METLKKIKALVRLNIGSRKLNSGLIPTKLPLVYCRNNTLTIENGLNLNRKNELWGIRLLSGTMVALKYGMKNSFATYNNAKELAETGQDHNGIQNPVYLLGWGGQSVILVYLMALCIKIFGYSSIRSLLVTSEYSK